MAKCFSTSAAKSTTASNFDRSRFGKFRTVGKLRERDRPHHNGGYAILAVHALACRAKAYRGSTVLPGIRAQFSSAASVLLALSALSESLLRLADIDWRIMPRRGYTAFMFTLHDASSAPILLYFSLRICSCSLGCVCLSFLCTCVCVLDLCSRERCFRRGFGSSVLRILN